MNWIYENYDWLLLLILGFLELVLRYVPTASNYSVLDKLISLLRFFVPNQRKRTFSTEQLKAYKPNGKGGLIKYTGVKRVVLVNPKRHV